MPQNAGQSLPHLGAPLSPSGGMLAGTAWDLAAHRAVGLPRGQRRAAELRVGAGAWVCGAAAAAIMPGGIRKHHCRTDAGSPDQDLLRSEAWLGKRQRLVGVIRAVVTSPPPQAHCCSCGRGEHLPRPPRGAGGRVEGWMMGHE
jgi:hypothetical protein